MGAASRQKHLTRLLPTLAMPVVAPLTVENIALGMRRLKTCLKSSREDGIVSAVCENVDV
jgi:hypothetical protein